MPAPKKTLKAVPRFASEEAERAFWGTHDSTDYLDWSVAERPVLPNLRPTTSTISLRIPEMLLHELKQLANKRDMPYQSLLKMFLAERIQMELRTMVSELRHDTPRKKVSAPSKARTRVPKATKNAR